MKIYVINKSFNVISTLVHRIGRTGRCGKTGLATTFINKSVGKYACNLATTFSNIF